jgi:hypothetical protein
MRTRESAPTLWVESYATRGLDQVELGNVDPIRGMLLGVWVVCHTPGLKIIFSLFETFTGRPRGGVSLCVTFRCG